MNEYDWRVAGFVCLFLAIISCSTFYMYHIYFSIPVVVTAQLVISVAGMGIGGYVVTLLKIIQLKRFYETMSKEENGDESKRN